MKLLLTLLLVVGTLTTAQQLDDVEEVLDKWFKDIKDTTDGALHIPSLPMIGSNDISLIFTGVEISGLRDFDRPQLEGVGNASYDRISLDLNFPSLSMMSSRYIAGGHIYKLPFVGESDMTAEVRNMAIEFSYGKAEEGNPLCAELNTTQFGIGVDTILVNFNDLNPGQDTGDVINSMMSNIGDDLMQVIENLINGPLYEAFDRLAVTVVNTVITDNVPLVTCDIPERNGTADIYEEFAQFFELLTLEVNDAGLDGANNLNYIAEDFLSTVFKVGDFLGKVKKN